MKPELAAQIVAADGDRTAKADAEAVIKAQISAEAAARRGYVDNIISADAARKNLVYAFEMLYLKEEGRPDKKHGTI